VDAIAQEAQGVGHESVKGLDKHEREVKSIPR
jgi:hypothetical protein